MQPHKVQVIKQIQNAGLAGIILPDIRIDGVPAHEIRAIVEHLVDSNLVVFRPNRDTYHWNGFNSSGTKTRETRKPTARVAILDYLQAHPEGATTKEIATATGRPEGTIGVYISDLRCDGRVVGREDPTFKRGLRKRYYLAEHAPAEVPRGTQVADDKAKTNENKAAEPAPDGALPAIPKAPHTESVDMSEVTENTEENGDAEVTKNPHNDPLPPVLDGTAECMLTIEYDGRVFEARGPHAAVDRWYQQFLACLERVGGGAT